ncbi:c-type cytochrome [Loktanella sp. M215]|uniref:c-type cytochrome n=1 Tax=Loktanella sp. M215 TaxID=2675431 RepID=UPI001F023B99|nr:c-type cytochrome [Loktanella sp. M215]
MNKRLVTFAGSALCAGLVTPAIAQDQFETMKDSCIACHGEEAEAEADVPALGGIDAYYALLQLVAFREGQRENEIMNGMVADFSDNDLRAASEWIGSLPPQAAPEDTPDQARMDAGAALAEEHRCNTCHGADYLGGHQMPPLRNQREQYVLKALGDYKAERRIGDRAAMVEVASALSDEDMQTLSYFVAHLE